MDDELMEYIDGVMRFLSHICIVLNNSLSLLFLRASKEASYKCKCIKLKEVNYSREKFHIVWAISLHVFGLLLYS